MKVQYDAPGEKYWFPSVHTWDIKTLYDTHRNLIITTDHWGSGSKKCEGIPVAAALMEECNPNMWRLTQRDALLPGYTMDWRLIHFPEQSQYHDFYDIRGLCFGRGTCLELIFRPVRSSHYEEHDESSASISQEEDDEYEEEEEEEQQDNGPARVAKKHKSK
jgi:hypothetical protein